MSKEVIHPMDQPCRVVLIPNPFPAEHVITTSQPLPARIAFPVLNQETRAVWAESERIPISFGQIEYRRDRCTRANHTGVTEAIYRPA